MTWTKSQTPDGPLCAVIGGGAAGYFAAINGAAMEPRTRFVLLEGTRRPLTKVRISGGGRCNVTHHCFDPAALVRSYPRGFRELRGPFSRFQPKDTVAWFAARGVTLKVEEDGRMFPTTDDSATISGCLQQAAVDAGVDVRLGSLVKKIQKFKKIQKSKNETASPQGGFDITMRGGTLRADRVLLATGGSPLGYKFAKELGHHIVAPVPSLFTFVVEDPRIAGLSGLSVPLVRMEMRFADDKKTRLQMSGPLLVTHWGLSGPAVLKLSAFGARPLHRSDYQATVSIDWWPDAEEDEVRRALESALKDSPKKLIQNSNPTPLPRRLWARLVAAAGLTETPWSASGRKGHEALVEQLRRGRFAVQGKGEFKDEFVTAGGVDLKQVDFRTLESRKCPGLYFAGEILDIDGITGGFNFQNAWTTGWLAGRHMAQR